VVQERDPQVRLGCVEKGAVTPVQLRARNEAEVQCPPSRGGHARDDCTGDAEDPLRIAEVLPISFQRVAQAVNEVVAKDIVIARDDCDGRVELIQKTTHAVPASSRLGPLYQIPGDAHRAGRKRARKLQQRVPGSWQERPAHVQVRNV
jgi:hypothetical protein